MIDIMSHRTMMKTTEIVGKMDLWKHPMTLFLIGNPSDEFVEKCYSSFIASSRFLLNEDQTLDRESLSKEEFTKSIDEQSIVIRYVEDKVKRRKRHLLPTKRISPL